MVMYTLKFNTDKTIIGMKPIKRNIPETSKSKNILTSNKSPQPGNIQHNIGLVHPEGGGDDRHLTALHAGQKGEDLTISYAQSYPAPSPHPQAVKSQHIVTTSVSRNLKYKSGTCTFIFIFPFVYLGILITDAVTMQGRMKISARNFQIWT